MYACCDRFATALEGDYIGVIDELIFTIGETRVCHTVDICDDEECEIDQTEDFYSDLTLRRGVQPISVVPSRTQVIIIDTDEPECGEY